MSSEVVKPKVGRPKGSIKRLNYSTKLTEKTKKKLEAFKPLGIQGNEIIECLVELYFDYLNPAILNKYKSGGLSKDVLLLDSDILIQQLSPATEMIEAKPTTQSADGFQMLLDNFINEDELIY
ncbi:MAG: hypothetical protein LBV08_06550 [Clostridiales bacterium]|nr:hypothetical protein [Clostridiales bacterium]